MIRSKSGNKQPNTKKGFKLDILEIGMYKTYKIEKETPVQELLKKMNTDYSSELFSVLVNGKKVEADIILMPNDVIIELPVIKGGGEDITFKTKVNTHERTLIEKFCNILIRGYNVEVRSYPNAFAESIISKIISEEAIKKGYNESDFNIHAFYESLRSKSKFFKNIIEKYEFLFRFSDIFTEKDRSALLEAIKTYREEVGLVEINSILQHLLKEYLLIKSVQEAYFKEHKKYLTLALLSIQITKEGHTLKRHFFKRGGSGKRISGFNAFTIFQIECWAKKNLHDEYLEEVQKKIIDWRDENKDISVYAVQNTLLRKISYSMLVLNYQVKNVVINIATLDNLLRKQIGSSFPRSFFTERVIPSYEKKGSLVLPDIMNLLKMFVKEKFQSKNSQETELLVKLIEEYNKIPRKIDILSSHSLYQGKIKPYQLKTLIDITKGLDPLDCKFFTDEELILPPKKGGVILHHIDEAPNYEFIFSISPDANKYIYRFKLAPLNFLESHLKVHRSTHYPVEIANDLMEARLRHLYELEKISYYKKISKEEYINIFKEIFKNRKDFIFKYGKEVNVWNSFEDGKIKGLNDVKIEEFVIKWIDSKEIFEELWYKKHYKKFYQKKYLPFIDRIKIYAKESLERIANSPFIEWFLTKYLPDEIFP